MDGEWEHQHIHWKGQAREPHRACTLPLNPRTHKLDRCSDQLFDVANGLAYMHGLRMVHGDLKGV